MMAINPETKKRGLLLTIWLVLILLLNLYGVYSNWTLRQDWLDHGRNYAFDRDTPGIIPLLFVIQPVVNILCVLLLWFWKKVGLSLFIVSVGGAFILVLSIGWPLPAALLGWVSVGILYALVRPRWQWFE
ncbi:MAG: hypothetical protein H6672_06850 [Anaerolineaceae bacterium]|nr:hypothetical protein [Anaerolineaceae bacterium]